MYNHCYPCAVGGPKTALRGTAHGLFIAFFQSPLNSAILAALGAPGKVQGDAVQQPVTRVLHAVALGILELGRHQDHMPIHEDDGAEDTQRRGLFCRWRRAPDWSI